jgi:hypothetical protein
MFSNLRRNSKMRKKILVPLALTLVFGLTACGSNDSDTSTTPTPKPSSATIATATDAEPNTDDVASDADADVATADDPTAKSEGVLTYDEYIAADLDTEVTIEAYVQAKQSWWDNSATVYLADADGAYFAYNMSCTEEEYDQIPTGTKIKVTGYKSEWSGEVEIVDATFEIEDGNYIAAATDLTADFADEDALKEHQNEFFSFTGVTVEAVNDDGDAYLFNWDGSGSEGDDIYFNVSLDGVTYQVVIESYLCDLSTDVYKAAESLNVGDVIDLEGFMYWYEGVNAHITSIDVQ